MSNLFHAYSVQGANIPTYFIESTAPNNVDDSPAPASAPSGLTPIDPDKAVEDIATHLSGAARPNLVIMIHGFNNPQKDVLTAYAEASRAIEGDPAICNRTGLVCVGYRWPSEKMGEPWHATLAALPSFPSWLLWCGILLFALYLVDNPIECSDQSRAISRPADAAKRDPNGTDAFALYARRGTGRCPSARYGLFPRHLPRDELRSPRPDRNHQADRSFDHQA